MKVGAGLSCSGLARGQRVPIVMLERIVRTGTTQMVAAGPAALVQYRSSVRVGRASYRFANFLHKPLNGSRNGRKKEMMTVNFHPGPCTLNQAHAI